mmetsp:Transcript_1765/g.5113  ORF Transcript_1765/g.5113 Transcript_1765/m.5113 type:complete len:261 (-) Transcript_1765:60-842(-)
MHGAVQLAEVLLKPLRKPSLVCIMVPDGIVVALPVCAVHYLSKRVAIRCPGVALAVVPSPAKALDCTSLWIELQIPGMRPEPPGSLAIDPAEIQLLQGGHLLHSQRRVLGSFLCASRSCCGTQPWRSGIQRLHGPVQVPPLAAPRVQDVPVVPALQSPAEVSIRPVDVIRHGHLDVRAPRVLWNLEQEAGEVAEGRVLGLVVHQLGTHALQRQELRRLAGITAHPVDPSVANLIRDSWQLHRRVGRCDGSCQGSHKGVEG